MDYIYYAMGYESDEVKADPKQIRLRHILHKQIKKSKIKLRHVSPFDINKFKHNNIVRMKKKPLNKFNIPLIYNAAP